MALLVLAVAAAGCSVPAGEPASEPDPSSLRRTAQGELVGFTNEEGAHVWRGIPYAQPPVGDLRWRAPRPPKSWSGQLDARHFGASCPQIASTLPARDGTEPGRVAGNEDCLYLNIYAPQFEPDGLPRGGDRLPVLFWIHGGGNSIGDAVIYEAGLLAVEQQVLVVTLHYRLGAFGWFAHPALRGRADGPDDGSGNYGILDLVRGLEWVRENITAFGGDPQRVTVFGESAGGRNTFALLLSPRAAGLFVHAIVQSGSARTTSLAEAENFRDDPEPGHTWSSREVLLRLLQRDGHATDRASATSHLAGMSDAEIAAYLRGMSTEEFLSIYEATGMGGMYRHPQLIRDGAVLPDLEPVEAFRAGRYNRVPTILGSNRDEAKLFMLFSSDDIARLGFLPLWLKNPDRYHALAEYRSNLRKAWGVDEPAKAMRTTQGPSLYAYRFDWDDHAGWLWLDLRDLLGAAHGLEVPFVFGHLSFGPATRPIFGREPREEDVALSRAMMSYWGRFARTGRPDRGRQGELPLWESWGAGPADDKFLIFDAQRDGGIRMSGGELSRDSVIRGIATDPRHESAAERCSIYRALLDDGEIDAAELADLEEGACRAAPAALNGSAASSGRAAGARLEVSRRRGRRPAGG